MATLQSAQAVLDRGVSPYVTRKADSLGGEPIIAGTRTTVRAIVETWRMGVVPEAILSHLPHLTLAQVFDALSYYQDNMTEINGDIERNRIADEELHPLLRDRALPS